MNLHSGHHLDADAVVLRTPPSTWDDLSIHPPLPSSYRLSTGLGIKVLARVDHPFWRENGLERTALSDGAAGVTWQGGEPQGAPGELNRVFPLLERGWQGKLLFAGESASPGFYGRMEGGLHSGALVARRLAHQLNLV